MPRKYLHSKEPEIIEGEVIRKPFTCDEVKIIDKEKRLIGFTISTERIDRMGDVIMVAGWKLKEFRKNPVILFAHNSRQPPIGKAIKVGKTEDALVATAQFMDKDLSEFADSIFRMYLEKFMRAVSVGFMPLDREVIRDEDENFTGIRFIKQELLEFSAVPIPANPDALIDARSKGINTQPFRTWAEEILDNWGNEEDSVLLDIYGLNKTGVRDIYRKASNASKPVPTPSKSEDSEMLKNLKIIKDKKILDNIGSMTLESFYDEEGEVESVEVVDVCEYCPFTLDVIEDSDSASLMTIYEDNGGIPHIRFDASNGEVIYEILGKLGRDQDHVLGKLVSSTVPANVVTWGQAHPKGTQKASDDEPWDVDEEIEKASVEDMLIMSAWRAGKPKDDLTKDDFDLLHHKAGDEHEVVWDAVVIAAANLPKIKVTSSSIDQIRLHLSKHYAEFGEEGPWNKSPAEWKRYFEVAAKGHVTAARNLCLSLFGRDVDPEEIWPLTDEEKEEKREAAKAEELKSKNKKKIIEDVEDDPEEKGFTSDDDDDDETLDDNENKGDLEEDPDDDDIEDINLMEAVLIQFEEFLDKNEDNISEYSKQDIRKLKFLAEFFDETTTRLKDLCGIKVKPKEGRSSETTKLTGLDGGKKYIKLADVHKIIDERLSTKIEDLVEEGIKKASGRLD